MMFTKILIANRGEIACRVIRTARHLGVRTVAVYSAADAQALHVALADEALLIGPGPARESYLSIERIVEAARKSGAQAVHPGYGFLSENADFAQGCAAAGIVFIGPSAASIRAIGDKAQAKTIMERAGIATVPGYQGEAQDADIFAAEALRLGYPVLIKAAAGGGGRGMRLVAAPRADFPMRSMPPATRPFPPSATAGSSSRNISSARVTSRCRFSAISMGIWFICSNAIARRSAGTRR